ncbi:MAG: glycosyltransferase family 2 protein [Planctomycetota bacterium]
MRYAVLIPVYNEREWLPRMIERLDAACPPRLPDGTPCARTLVLVDDGSTDGSDELVRSIAQRDDAICDVLPANAGKGAALRRAIELALQSGVDAAIVQDADLEYDPGEHPAVLAPILSGQADAVIGTRFLGETHRVLYYWHSIANRLITTASNMLSNLNLTDIECGFKAFTSPVMRRLRLTENRFGVEPEIVARLAKMRLRDGDGAHERALRIYEVPIGYAGRTYAEGKKIGWRDGVSAIRAIARHNLFG